MADASRWAGVAASMGDYLARWQTTQDTPPVPQGIFAAVRRLLGQALEGINLERHQRARPELPVLATITSLHLALGVFGRLPGATNKLDEVEQRIRAYLAVLGAFEADEPRPPIDRRQVEDMQGFFRELLVQGRKARRPFLAG